MKKRSDKSQKKVIEKLVGQFQVSLGNAVILLMELKNKPGISLGTRSEINKTVEELQAVITRLPYVTERRKLLDLVFESIKKLFLVVWRRAPDL